MMTPDQGGHPGELTDNDLDQLLASANEELLAHIKTAADPTSTLVAIMARTAEEAAVVNRAIEEFQSIMESAGDGITGADHFTELRWRLAKLLDSMPELHRTAVSDEGMKVVGGLEEAVRENVAEFDKARAYHECASELQQIMVSVKGGIESADQLRALHRRLEALRAKIGHARSAAKDGDARHALGQLATTVERHLEQLKKLDAGLRITAIVEMFNKVMKELSEAGPLSPSDARQKRQSMEAIRAAARAERSRTSDKNAKDVLSKLDRVATQVIQALGG
jgi:polyhydroxyalkanoate synthesis regulator phasin